MQNKIKLSIHQIQIWLNDPVTKAYQSCISGEIDRIGEFLKGAAFVDTRSAVKTLATVQAARGQREGLLFAENLNSVLTGNCEVTDNV